MPGIFFAHPSLIASRSGRAYRLAPRPDQAAPWEYGKVGDQPSRYVPFDGELPPDLAAAIREWPGPCAHWGAYCDDGPHSRPLFAAAPELAGVEFPAEEYAANAALKSEQDAAYAARQAAEEAWLEGCRRWYLAHRGDLSGEAMAACGPFPGSAWDWNRGWTERIWAWLEARAATEEPARLRAELGGFPGSGWPYLHDVQVGTVEEFGSTRRVTMPEDFRRLVANLRRANLGETASV